MKYVELMILLPCHSLEDFPLYHEGEEAEGLLAAWSALWHPALIASAGRLPSWARADGPPEQVANKLLVIPKASDSLLLAGWPTRAKNEGACVVRKLTKRAEIVQAALASLDDQGGPIDPDLAADFLALGYVYLMLNLLTRQLRQFSNLDEIHLQNEVVSAAASAQRGNVEEARGHLKNCFDVLLEARERMYAAEAYFLDFCLVADTTLGEPLKAELERATPVNFLLTGRVLERLAEQDRNTLERLKTAWADGRIGLLGGDWDERDLPFQALESILWGFQQGREVFSSLLGNTPTIYARRRYGLGTQLPRVLAGLGYAGAAHFTLDDGHFPKGEQSKGRWEGLDGAALDALGRLPLEAQKPSCFLNLPEKLGETMDLDFVATLCFAHWPGDACEWYDDLRRMVRYAPVLGRFLTVEEYFRKTESPSQNTKHLADAYRSPYLKQAIRRKRENGLSRYLDHTRRQLQWAAGATLDAIAGALLELRPEFDVQAAANELRRQLESSAGPADDPPPADLDARLTDYVAQAAQRWAAALPRSTSGTAGGFLLVNPLSFSRRLTLDLPGLTYLPAAQTPIRAAQKTKQSVALVVDVPALGYVWIPKTGKDAPQPKLPKPLAEDLLLRNEFFEVYVDKYTGAIRAIHDYESRGNRLSQQIAFRLPAGARPQVGDTWKDPHEGAEYSVMAADSVTTTAHGTAFGELVSRGRLLDKEGKELAKFRQVLRLWRGSRFLSIDLTLEPNEVPKADPWNSYYAMRLAWNDEAGDVFVGTPAGRLPTNAKKLEAPLFVETRWGEKNMVLLAGGLPLHLRCGLRMLDTLLQVKGESRQNFRLAVGLDVEQPYQAALNFLAPAPVVSDAGRMPTAGASSWLFHLDRKNVLVTSWEPLSDGDRLTGLRIRIQELAGREGAAKLRCFRAPGKAQKTNFLGQPSADLTVTDDAVEIPLQAYEWAQVELAW